MACRAETAEAIKQWPRAATLADAQDTALPYVGISVTRAGKNGGRTAVMDTAAAATFGGSGILYTLS